MSLFDASGDSRIRVLRRDDKTQKFVPHGYFPPTATEEHLLREFGGGYYWCQLLVIDEAGRSVVKQQKYLDLPGAYRAPKGDLPGIREETPKDGVAAPGGLLPTGGDLASVLNATVLATFMDLIKTMKEVTTRPTPSPDPMLLQMMQQQSALQMKFMEVMLARPETPAGDTKKDLLDMLRAMRDLFPPPEHPASVANPNNPTEVIKTIVDAIKGLREVSDELSPDRQVDPMSQIIAPLAEVVISEHRARQGTRQRRLPAPAAAAPQPGGSVDQSAAGAAASQAPLWQRVLAREGPRLLAQARVGRDPGFVAQMALEFAPPNIRGAIEEFFNAEEKDVLARLLAQVPELAEHPQWAVEFVQEAQDILFGTDEEEEPEPANLSSESASGAEVEPS